MIGIIQKGSSSLCTDKFPIVNIDILHNCKNNEEIILFFWSSTLDFQLSCPISCRHDEFELPRGNTKSKISCRHEILDFSRPHVNGYNAVCVKQFNEGGIKRPYNALSGII